MSDWSIAALWVGLGFAAALGLVGSLWVYKNPSVECVRIEGTWVPYPGTHTGYCTTRKP